MNTVPVRLGCLAYGEEFTLPLTRRRGTVVNTGWVPWDDGHGRRLKMRAVRVRFASGEEANLRAAQPVLVPADRKHVAGIEDYADRWEELLREPGSMGTLGEIARRKRA